MAYPLLTCLYNWCLLRLAGEDGVAAFGAIMYLSCFFIAVLHGFALGSAPLASYHFGAGSRRELANVFRKCAVLNAVASLVLAGLCFALAEPLAAIYTGYDGGLYALTAHALKLYAPMFLLCWVNTYGSSFLTALGRGLASIAIASLRTLVFGSLAIMLLPELLGLDGVWLAWGAAELATILATVFLLARERR
ncbi:MAG: hypothetical protein K6E40_04600, partial [Desulfovibrio sp.]|nr:hypothetical protein [Desulfovibrio sp.]